MKVERETFSIDTDKTRLDIALIQSFLTNDSYWAQDRTIEQTRTAIENSICFGLYDGTAQIGFGRVVSDQATFAYVGDVFVIDSFRSQGLSKWLMETMMEHPDLQGLRRWILATRDAHGLYQQFGFDELKHPDRWMEKPAPNAY